MILQTAPCTIPVLLKDVHGNVIPEKKKEKKKSEAGNELYLPDTFDFVFYLLIHFCQKYFEHAKHLRPARHLDLRCHLNRFPPSHQHLCYNISLPKLHRPQMLYQKD